MIIISLFAFSIAVLINPTSGGSSEMLRLNSNTQLEWAPPFTVCPGDYWSNLVFAKNPVNASTDFKVLSSWTAPDWRDYLGTSVVPRATISFAFFAFTILLLLSYLTWRLIRFCCMFCCGKCKTTWITQDVLQSRIITITKVLGLCICLGITATAIYGMVTPMENKVSEGWQVGDQLRGYVDKINSALAQVQSDLVNLRSVISVQQNALIQMLPRNVAIPYSLTQTLSSVTSQLNTINSDLQDIISAIQSSRARIQNEVLDRYDSSKLEWQETTLDAWDIAVKVSYGLFGLALLMMLLIAAAALPNWAFGVGALALLQLLLSLAFFAIAVAFAFGIVVVQDGCSNMETIALQLAPTDGKDLVRFYLDPGSISSKADILLDAAGIGLKQDVKVQINDTIEGLFRQLDQSSISNSALVIKMLSLPTMEQQVRVAISKAMISIGQAYPPSNNSGALGLGNLASVQREYITAKQYLCCSVPSLAARLWTLSTVLGWLGIGLALACLMLIVYFDRVQEMGQCCTCSCLQAAKLPSSGKPFSLSEGSESTQGQPEQTLSTQLPPSQLEVVRVEVAPAGRGRETNLAVQPQAQRARGLAVPTWF